MSKEFTQASDRQDRRIRERVHDPYMLREEPPQPAVCTECGVVLDKGSWRWDEAPADAHQLVCPACRRMQDNVPAGFVTLSGEFFDAHRDEIMNRVRNVEERENSLRPLKRIMGVEETEDGGVLITTTDMHLARGIGQALHDAWEGDFDYQYTDESSILRVTWRR